MVPRSQFGTPAPEPSVRFYKIVALSFLGVTLILLGLIIFMSSKRATITVLTKPEPVEIRASVGVNTGEEGRRITGVVTSTVLTVEKKFSPTGTKEEPGIATGKVTIYNETANSQPLVATTRLETPEKVLFRIKTAVVVPANGSVDVEVYADKEGTTGNIKPSTFIIPGLSSAALREAIYAKSTEEMTGGTRTIGVLSTEDVEKAKKALLAQLEEAGKNELKALYPEYEGTFVADVGEVEMVGDTEVGTEVSEFTLKGLVTVAAVFYRTEDLQRLGEQMLMTRAIDDAVAVQPSAVAPSTALVEYDVTKGTAFLDTVYHGMATVNPESNQLQKLMFYGKTKDEIRRYLLSIDHVHSVDVQMRPAWVQTVPHVAEHVNVVVTKTQ